MDGLEVKKGAYIGLDNKHIHVTGTDRTETAKALIKKLMEMDPKDVVIVFYGEGVSEDEVAGLQDFLSEQFPMVDVGFVNGKQGIYDFIISLE
jgi:dihydroxyacetone kinase-like predicted kinase